MNKLSSKLYLIPNLISDVDFNTVVPSSLPKIVEGISFFIVEDIRNARRYLRKLSKTISIDDLEFFELNKHTNIKDISSFLTPAIKGHDMGLISEAGLPCIADPGNVIVKMAHNNNIKVVPISGPSSIFMALMSSGLNGQNFAFNGYVPIEQHLRIKKLKELEKKAHKEKQSQIFMDTPYRNNKLFADMLEYLNSNTYLCVAVNISSEHEFIKTMKIADWKNKKIDLHKKPCIFII